MVSAKTLLTYSVVAKESSSFKRFKENQSVAERLRMRIRDELKLEFDFNPKIETAFYGCFEWDGIKTSNFFCKALKSVFEKIKTNYDQNNQVAIYVVAMAADEDVGLIEFSL